MSIRQDAGHQLYDSMIVAGALTAGVSTLFSEGLQDGRRFGDLTTVNPFRDLSAAAP